MSAKGLFYTIYSSPHLILPIHHRSKWAFQPLWLLYCKQNWEKLLLMFYLKYTIKQKKKAENIRKNISFAKILIYLQVLITLLAYPAFSADCHLHSRSNSPFVSSPTPYWLWSFPVPPNFAHWKYSMPESAAAPLVNPYCLGKNDFFNPAAYVGIFESNPVLLHPRRSEFSSNCFCKRPTAAPAKFQRQASGCHDHRYHKSYPVRHPDYKYRRIADRYRKIVCAPFGSPVVIWWASITPTAAVGKFRLINHRRLP